MKNIVLFDTSIASTNKGDDIIMYSAVNDLKPVLQNSFTINVPTHLTPFSAFQSHFWWKAKWVKNADLKFVCGTNLLWKSLRNYVNDLNINIFNCSSLNNLILVGVGNALLDKKIDAYTRIIYKKILSHDFIHSTRDDETRDMLREMGFKAETTGCVTLWPLTKEHCQKIPIEKSQNVVFTLNGAIRDQERDQYMLDLLKEKYDKRYMYIQTIWDLPYLKTLKDVDDVILIDPDINIYSEFLKTNEIDYVGNRLHGGVFAMQHGKRAIIVNVDNRARNMSKVNNLNIIERENIKELGTMIESKIRTDIQLDFNLIDKWMKQFI